MREKTDVPGTSGRVSFSKPMDLKTIMDPKIALETIDKLAKIKMLQCLVCV